MSQLFEPETLVILLLFGLPVFTVIGHYCHKISKTNSDNELKRRLVERGFSVDEIERVINAGVKKDDD